MECSCPNVDTAKFTHAVHCHIVKRRVQQAGRSNLVASFVACVCNE